jgi:anti-sigma B factor antagonist
LGTILDRPAVWPAYFEAVQGPPGSIECDGSGGCVLTIHQQESPEGYTVCRPVGELDAFTVSQLRQDLAELATSRRLLIDMSGIPFVDSAGLGALIGGIRRTRELGGEVAVACNRPTLARLLRTTGFDRIVTVAETVEEAAEALKEVPIDDVTEGAAVEE